MPRVEKEQKLTIQQIVQQSEGTTVKSGRSMLEELEKKVRRSVEARRVEHDRTQYKAKVQARELEKLKLLLADLKKNGHALGLDEYPDESERMRPVKCISNRPVYSKHTRIHAMSLELAKKQQEIDEMERTGLVYAHIRDRLRTERFTEGRKIWDLKEQLKEEQVG